MFPVLRSLIAVTAALLAFAPLDADADQIIVDVVEQHERVGWKETLTYTHDINDDDFELGSATSAFLEVLISDDERDLFDWLPEVLLFVVEDFDFDTGELNFGTSFAGGLEVAALGALNADGFLTVTFTSVFGDFYVGDSKLTVVTSVPEPGTLGLLGLGLLAVGAGWRRRKP